MVADKSADDDDDGSSDEDVVTPGFNIRYAKSSTYGQDNKAYD
jgi:hypothetical protein